MFSLDNRSISNSVLKAHPFTNAQPAEQASLNYLSNLKGRRENF
jgi:hypothetical protein